ncbi:MAG: putative K(+)-stimulated pyrophosphate-energized sodium pump [Fimbriimonadaceae bacterium]|nr:putative K(+)-stimulated pyrophosphate-energized sodium pump [Fimbriimonadaceae bacterium]
MMALAPVAFASGGENIRLQFTASDRNYLFASLAFGVLACVVAWMYMKKLMALSPGNEKMQEVGAAIQQGAMAYLRRQINTMLKFVVLLMIGLFFLYNGQFGWQIAAWLCVCFFAGVAASYIAGFLGMKMAVAGNTRTAHAALTSYKNALEIAFRSGAVAGLFTVGMGLIGATLIFLFANENAMKLLIGFGFGGSLAALFMRVGGGIFTKAADVGADLVGKVEAGIPEDDPRNPAVIADNVGDNVGDCAGMAADIFESYEVTLVAAIVLGAATAAIFEPAMWMKLILFALMARGVGILASIIGIWTMKGSDDLKSDPLHSISKGFKFSAALAVVGTGILAFLMMGGLGDKVVSNKLISIDEHQRNEFRLVKDVQAEIAKREKKDVLEVTQQEIQDDERIKKAGLGKVPAPADPTKRDPNAPQDFSYIVQRAMQMDLEKEPKLPSTSGWRVVDFNDENNPVLKYTVMKPPTPESPKPEYTNFRELHAEKGPDGKWVQKPIIVYKLRVTQTPPSPPVEKGKPAPPAPEPVTQERYYGPFQQAFFDKQIEDAMKAQPGNLKIEKVEGETKYVKLYQNNEGEIMLGVENVTGEPHRLGMVQSQSYFKPDVALIQSIVAEREKDPMNSRQMPQEYRMGIATVEHKPVEWWQFFACIFFGIAMAFAIEKLTDYYVSTGRKPVNEVAQVATAGPAPMIIQGFALGKESSVFSVFAIVIALLFPMFIFPPAQYGGYLLSFYGIALVGLGLLTTTGYILAMDTFGPISDNAQGVFEMSGAGHEHPEASRAVQRLDAAGNTTKALTKGFAIATAVVAAVALFHSYIEGAKLADVGLRLEVPEIFLGLMIGGAAPYLFSAFSINAVGRASFQLINEVRRQFREDPGIMAGTSKPNYGRCVDIVTAAAQKELLGPGILAISLPALVGFGFSIGKEYTVIGGQQYNLVGAQALGGFLAGAILSGQLLAVLLANSGGIWDNAKKLIEDGMHGGKGTEAHKAGVVCDTVGDPFKDTAGPALNPLIKVMNLFALLVAPYVILPLSNAVLISITAASLFLLILAIWVSKRGSLASEMTALTGGGDSGTPITPDREPVESPA